MFIATVTLLFSSSLWAQVGLPDDLHAMPIAETLPGHEWSYQQGLDFDIIRYENEAGNGLRFYMDVSTKGIESSDYIDATVMNKPVKLFKQCSDSKVCMYTTTIDSGIVQNGRELITQIWLKPDSNNINAYIEWLSSLKFISGAAKKS